MRLDDRGAEVELSWSPVEGADSYDVLRGEDPVALAPVARVVATAHVESGLAPGTTYWYAVRAVNVHGGGIPSAPTKVERLSAPGRPTALSAIAGHDFVRLQWSAPEETGGVAPEDVLHLVERRREGDARFVVVANDLRSTAYTDRSVEAGTNYTYTVSAVNRVGRGAASDAVDVHVSAAANRRPLASLSAKPSGTEAGEEVTLDASFSSDPDGTVAEYLFDFGDGGQTEWALTPTVAHAYRANGVYTASVRVRDEQGLESATPALARVVIGPPPDEKQQVDAGGPTNDTDEVDEMPPPGTTTPGVPGAGALVVALGAAVAAAVRRRRVG